MSEPPDPVEHRRFGITSAGDGDKVCRESPAIRQLNLKSRAIIALIIAHQDILNLCVQIHHDAQPGNFVKQTVDDRLGRVGDRKHPAVCLGLKLHASLCKPIHRVFHRKAIKSFADETVRRADIASTFQNCRNRHA